MNVDELAQDIAGGYVSAYAVAFCEQTTMRGYVALVSARARRISRLALKLGDSEHDVSYAVLLFVTGARNPGELLSRDSSVLAFVKLSLAHVRRLKIRMARPVAGRTE